jgi:catechol 2,3-dioxygenase-like lactoylglutathione lyase family enzyme
LDFLRVRLRAPAGSLGALAAFYADRLGVEVLERSADLLALRTRGGRLEFVAAAGRPFYHFALLVPGDRFEAALAWARERTELLPGGDLDGVVFDFSNWDALAFYFHDPAGNIVELIAHRGVAEPGATGRFSAAELAGLSELGLVGDPRALATPLEHELELRLWDGTLEEAGRLAFVGERARTLILSPPGRGWLPTGRPAEAHPVEAVLSGEPGGEIAVNGHRIERSGRTSHS